MNISFSTSRGSYNSNNEAFKDIAKKIESNTADADDNDNRIKPKYKGVNVTTYTDKEGRVHKTFTGTGTSVIDSMKKANEKTDDDEPKLKKRLNYSYQKVSSQVLMAKTSISASKAVLMARRALTDLKKKIAESDCSEDEKQAALAHANSMLRIAKKKKKNLEMEELIKNTIKADETNSTGSLTLSDAKFDIDGTDDEMDGEDNASDMESNAMPLDELSSTAIESDIEESDIEELSEDMLSDLGDEVESMMEDAMKDMLDLMDVINPHMDKNDFDVLKTKHRLDEQKEIVKADMDYLKVYMKAIQNSSESFPVSNTNIDISGALQGASLSLAETTCIDIAL